MFFFGHVGITVGLSQLVNTHSNKKIDLRKAAFFAVLPDLIDKPLGILFADYFELHSRLYAHSLVWAVLLMFGLWAYQKKLHHPFIYWFCYLGHDFLDRIWEKDLNYFLWPFMPRPQAYHKEILERWAEAITLPYSMFGESLGLSILVFLFVYYRLYARSNFYSFLKSGALYV